MERRTEWWHRDRVIVTALTCQDEGKYRTQILNKSSDRQGGNRCHVARSKDRRCGVMHFGALPTKMKRFYDGIYMPGHQERNSNGLDKAVRVIVEKQLVASLRWCTYTLQGSCKISFYNIVGCNAVSLAMTYTRKLNIFTCKIGDNTFFKLG